ncbi:uncharacterized protein LOC134727756 [Mytilus trossulus]|uniref:uncharacterized protein LOC134727756 n=1 Tax=Mytilus trossulus TaxID=6551 RepID=UPI0030052DBE
MLESYEYSFETGTRLIDQRRGILTLIPKKDKDRTLLSNWRPKLLAKVITERMKLLLPELIAPYQTGYVAGRYIGENLRLIADIILLTTLKNYPGLILLVDFKKAFDTQEWKFIQKALVGFNFGSNIRKWVLTLYSNISSLVVNNGFSSSPFTIERGVRQGCPLTPL